MLKQPLSAFCCAKVAAGAVSRRAKSDATKKGILRHGMGKGLLDALGDDFFTFILSIHVNSDCQWTWRSCNRDHPGGKATATENSNEKLQGLLPRHRCGLFGNSQVLKQTWLQKYSKDAKTREMQPVWRLEFPCIRYFHRSACKDFSASHLGKSFSFFLQCENKEILI